MRQQTPNTRSAGELRLLVAGSVEAFYEEFLTVAVQQHLGYARVRVQIIHDLQPLLEAAAQSPPDLLLIYLHFGDPADETVADLASCRRAIVKKIEDAAGHPCSITACGLRLVPCLRAEFNLPVIVLSGSEARPGRATRVEQAGAAAFLPVPFTMEQCAAALATGLERNS